MPNILAIETATEACSAALISFEDNSTDTDVNTAERKGAEPKIFSQFKLAPREHTKLILPMIEEVLKVGGCTMDDIDAIAFGRGPGAFTGLRIAAGISQGLALSIDKPVIPVSTLSALALQSVSALQDRQQKYSGETILVGLDARMDEVYWGAFEFQKSELILINDEKVTKMVEIGEYIDCFEGKHFLGIGSAWDVYTLETLDGSVKNSEQSLTIIENAFPSATEIARLAMIEFLQQRTVAIEDAQPVYIRNNVAKKSRKQ
ncbi:tRNA (adenosine(37)-N6)-threonylcarbamoyltransferase complex dimerization subunit type 1 TsaB [Cocleimonas sp. KMM 6892]|uniref:tRNA (adenosine(37)-N6)-threonylcarbamoyltransferase complex dimerization subunit type 1 TsaB n=1 Tax=unclassified Cocleimonas TaxID=2639732 RepID=UPI002DB78C2A|nr:MULTISPECIES: tRNA (adenosine(37)-N6)-threonylcarbamoyltransferase complex dimerization subunit type 1 TsaB [unclassified Cocleimonas]MEB8434108.1 tRNA (adenosine(37)-N6)-threonylcarbamoyltransferase complex dimerization subunit type 1 TsaB [Cocleimonas sp. KMM 6892]MEC4717032.1 tRNA (adenosine(37)-N6)-threonylcarbamoyltransferase complex dimerization subunit type 1 TsaB [Cocleimonas sp. KMM 6895]MEC4746380.1 tRNA (adenosine(37)-N6)-threonylcarbamoyltransferase complex dimerization subunit ty